MSQERKSSVGDPIWVESLMTTEEHVEMHKKYPSTVTRSKPMQYDPNHHTGGKWREGIGKGYSLQEIDVINKAMDNLYNLLKNQKIPASS